MDGEFQEEGADRKKLLLYGGIGLAALLVIGGIVFMIVRNRSAGQEGSVAPPPVNGSQTGTEPTGAELGTVTTDQTEGFSKEQLAIFEAVSRESIKNPEFELNIEKTMTQDELNLYGFPPGTFVTYKWMLPEGGDVSATPIMVITSTPIEPPPGDPAQTTNKGKTK